MNSDTTKQQTGGIGQPAVNPNNNLAIRYGFLGGFVMAIIGILSYLFYRQLFSSMLTQSVVGFLFLVIMVFIPIWGTISFKRAMGSLTFAQALSACMTIIFIMLVCSNVVSYIIPNFLDTDYPQQLYDLVRSNTETMMEKFNSTDEQIEEAMKRISLEQFTPTLSSTVRSLGISLAFGFVLSLIVALFVTRGERKAPAQNTEA